ncbi:hypothetical protein OESDEN_01507 [Oesophagostomum dentatum]|uniref:Uncharacterized protein n=1 Tax=Oesophagostomum dentatum TaxID=61180 RepID=A0A0B1TLS4_OESDE|nr:hypothetical protein OESDEN_01507 [Oesophagostomum dentatum]
MNRIRMRLQPHPVPECSLGYLSLDYKKNRLSPRMMPRTEISVKLAEGTDKTEREAELQRLEDACDSGNSGALVPLRLIATFQECAAADWGVPIMEEGPQHRAESVEPVQELLLQPHSVRANGTSTTMSPSGSFTSLSAKLISYKSLEQQ